MASDTHQFTSDKLPDAALGQWDPGMGLCLLRCVSNINSWTSDCPTDILKIHVERGAVVELQLLHEAEEFSLWEISFT